MRRKHLLLLCLTLACSSLCFVLLDPHAHEVPEPRSEPMRAVVGEAPAVEVPIRERHEAAVGANGATKQADIEKAEVASASPPTATVERPSLANSAPAFIAGTVVVPSEWELKSLWLEFDVPAASRRSRSRARGRPVQSSRENLSPRADCDMDLSDAHGGATRNTHHAPRMTSSRTAHRASRTAHSRTRELVECLPVRATLLERERSFEGRDIGANVRRFKFN